MNPVEKVKSITLNDSSECNGGQKIEYKSTVKIHLNALKDPVSQIRGHRGGISSQENSKKLVEFKNMFIELYETLFGPEKNFITIQSYEITKSHFKLHILQPKTLR